MKTIPPAEPIEADVFLSKEFSSPDKGDDEFSGGGGTDGDERDLMTPSVTSIGSDLICASGSK